MPTKFKKDGLDWSGSFGEKKSVVKRYYIKNTSQEELIEYINNDRGQPKIKQKCRIELTRRGVRLVKVDPAKITMFDL
jgi:hypothetical protein